MIGATDVIFSGFTIIGDETMYAGVVITPSSFGVDVVNSTIFGMTLSNPSNDSPLSYGVLSYGNGPTDKPSNICALS